MKYDVDYSIFDSEISTNKKMNDKIRDSFVNPKHFGSLNTEYVGEAGNFLCGDSIKICAKVSNGSIEDAKFQAAGCIYSFSCAEAVSEIVIGKTLEEADTISESDVVEFFNGLPDGKEHCANMAIRALKKAIEPKTAEVEEPPLKLKTDKEWKHIIAELFDEFIIEEAKRQNSTVRLENMDIPSKTIDVYIENSSPSVKGLVKEIIGRLGQFTIKFFGRT